MVLCIVIDDSRTAFYRLFFNCEFFNNFSALPLVSRLAAKKTWTLKNVYNFRKSYVPTRFGATVHFWCISNWRLEKFWHFNTFTCENWSSADILIVSWSTGMYENIFLILLSGLTTSFYFLKKWTFKIFCIILKD